MTCFVLVPGWIGLLLTLVELVSFGKVKTFHCYVFFEQRWSRPDQDVNFNFDVLARPLASGICSLDGRQGCIINKLGNSFKARRI